MIKTNVKDIGSVVFWNDYIKSEYRRSDGEVRYFQSNTPMKDYCVRTIGVTRRESGWVVSVALSRESLTPKTDKSGKGVVTHRIRKLIDNGLSTTEDDKGITWVPYSYSEMLYNDEAAYNGIFGPIDPSFLKMAINHLNEQRN